ncbi:protein of unknown function [Caballeronia sp. S22]
MPLCGAAVTFFAAAKKVTKESSSFRPAVTRTLAMLASRPWPSPEIADKRLAHSDKLVIQANWFSTELLRHSFLR